MSTDLLFGPKAISGLPADLVFGADDTPVAENRTVAVSGMLPGLRGRVSAHAARRAGIFGAFPALSGRAVARYDSNTERPLVCDRSAQFQGAVPQSTASRATFRQSLPHASSAASRFSEAQVCPASVSVRWQEAQRFRGLRASVFQEAKHVGFTPGRTHYQDGVRLRGAARSIFEEAARVPFPVARGHYQEAFRDRRNFTAARFQIGHAYSVELRENEDVAAPLRASTGSRYQEARKPLIGVWIPGTTPGATPCYTPTVPADLVFGSQWSDDTNLVLVCERVKPPDPGKTVVVPIREIYLTINSSALIRVDTGDVVPATSMSMSLDYESWTWTFSAAVPGHALDMLRRNSNGDPVVVLATVNGIPFSFVVESLSRDRSFGSSQLRVQGRGLAAELDAPYAPTLSFANKEARTGRQLLDDILTLNGTTIGWAIGSADFIDWNVPAKVFNHNGTYISALNAVAGAIGAYIQPHNTDRKLDVLLRYPTPSWSWGDVTPDFELPAAVTSQESIEWANNATYNRVFVVGQGGGISGQYSRAGTAGDLVASTITDPLITEAAAARQRGRAVLSEGGQVATVTLKMPVLPETGIIKPGKFIRYADGGTTRVGLSRGVSVDIAMPTIYQNVRVETHG